MEMDFVSSKGIGLPFLRMVLEPKRVSFAVREFRSALWRLRLGYAASVGTCYGFQKFVYGSLIFLFCSWAVQRFCCFCF